MENGIRTFGSAPVLLVAFNRLEQTRRVLAEIRRAAPERFFAAVDGPRIGHPDDVGQCSEVVETIQRGVDWKCTAKYLVRKANLGCREAVAQAVSWFFDNVDEGIILEDDCLPAPQFFPFCTSLLERYRKEVRIGQIGGFNCQHGRVRGGASYYFSKYFHVWGWASWRRAWEGFDLEMKDYDAFLRDRGLERLFSRRSIRDFWKDNFDEVANRKGNTWDYQWVYHNFKFDRLAIVPNWNMIENIGFGAGSTHADPRRGRTPQAALDVPKEISHPAVICGDAAADDFTYRRFHRMGRFHDMKQLVKRALGIGKRPHV